MRLLSSLCVLLFCLAAGAAETNLISNNRFDNGLAGWSPLWTRQAGAGTATIERQAGTNILRIDHKGSNDCSFEWSSRIPVKPGDIFELDAVVKVQGDGSATLCASAWNTEGKNINWSYGARNAKASTNWTHLRSRFVIPPGVAHIQPRLLGYGPATVWAANISLTPKPGLSTIRSQNLPSKIILTNGLLAVVIDTGDAAITVLDNRTGRTWKQKATHSDTIITSAHRLGNKVELGLMDVPAGMDLRAELELEPNRPEFTFKLAGQGPLPASLRYPFPFAGQPGDRLIVPMNEGISYPVEDQSIETFSLIAYGGHGICMAFWGVTDGDQGGHSAIIETPDDATIQVCRLDGRLAIAPQWDPQKGEIGYPRQLRYVFFDRGGPVAMAKRYREYAKKTGLFKTLAEKRQENPNVDLLIGAVNVWNWDSEPVALVQELQAAGIERILWSRGGTPEALRKLNEMKVLTSRYDIYQDVMDPANFSLLPWRHGDWTTAAWPNDIVKKADGDWLRGWGIEGKKGDWFYCGVTCDKRAVDYARQRIPDELAKSPYQCRFIDTTTAAPWNECYDSRHPMTRTESRQWKMKLLDFVSHDMKQVTGCETGHDASVPFLHYFEGMLSLGPYRVPDAGRDMQRIWQEVPEQVAKFQLGHRYRLPLWELVYHDCVVAQWYWGDYNNKLPSLWEKRDLFNLLYGTPPMFMFDKKLWQTQKERFVQSYRNICPSVRATGYSEMTDFKILTPDRDVQQSIYANGTVITVNFGSAPYRLASGDTIQPMGFHVAGIPKS